MDKLLLGLSTTATGMLVVFCGLFILICCIYAMTVFTGRQKKEAPRPQAAPVPAAPVRDMAFDQPDEENDAQAVVAIAAAIAMIWQSEGRESGFVVRRIRRSPARARAVREEQIFSRL